MTEDAPTAEEGSEADDAPAEPERSEADDRTGDDAADPPAERDSQNEEPVPPDRSAGPADSAVERAWLSLRGAVGFLMRLPVGTDLVAWESFRRTPTAMVVVGYVVGVVLAVPFALPLPAPTLALVFPAAVVAVTGINHADGLADLADAAAVHGEGDVRRRVLKDSAVGVGGTMALALLVAGLALAGLLLAGRPLRAVVAIVVASEVGAKLGMALLACLGEAPVDGLGAQLARVSTESDVVGPVAAALPVGFVAYPSLAPAASLAAAVTAAGAVLWWADRAIGGVNGDVFGAANELARLAALHTGVVVWTLS